jgi:hypothetical protein
MKTVIFVLAGALVSSFTVKQYDEDIDGFWMGYTRSEMIKEKVIVKLNGEEKMEFYTGGVDDRTRADGTYRLLGDSVSFSYTTPDGETITMTGHINRRKNFVDGIWKTGNKTTGSFYLEKQKLEEYYARP